jgi:hypothetical protein
MSAMMPHFTPHMAFCSTDTASIYTHIYRLCQVSSIIATTFQRQVCFKVISGSTRKLNQSPTPHCPFPQVFPTGLHNSACRGVNLGQQVLSKLRVRLLKARSYYRRFMCHRPLHYRAYQDTQSQLSVSISYS